MSYCGRLARFQGSLSYKLADGLLKVAGGATVHVYAPGTTTHLSIFSDMDGTAKTNPFAVDSFGWADFFIDSKDCHFDLRVEPQVAEFTPFTRVGVLGVLSNAAAEFNVMDFGATGDGVTDDEPAINDLIDMVGAQAVTSGLSTIRFPRGVYLVKKPIIPDGKTLTGVAVKNVAFIGDPGATIKAATPAQGGGPYGGRGGIFEFRDDATVTRENFTFQGFALDGQSFGTTGNCVAGFVLRDLKNITIRDTVIQNIGDPAGGNAPGNDGILVGPHTPPSTAHPVQDLRIENVRCINCVRNGISIIDGKGVTIVDPYVEHAGHAGIDIEPELTAQFAYDISIRDAWLFSCANYGIVATPGSALTPAQYPGKLEALRIRDCYIDGDNDTLSGILVIHWIDPSIKDNQIYRIAGIPASFSGSGIQVSACKSPVVRGNTIADGTVAVVNGIITEFESFAAQMTNGKFDDNIIRNLTGQGMAIVNLDGGTVQGNVVDDTDNGLTGVYAIRLDTGFGKITRRVTVSGNVCTNTAVGLGVQIGAGCTKCILGVNVLQANGADTLNQVSDLSPSTIWIGNHDQTQSDRPWVSTHTPMAGYPLTDNVARRMTGEVSVAAGAAAGSVTVASDFVNTTVENAHVHLIALTVDAAAMVGSATGVYTDRVATGFRLVHGGNPGGAAAIFGFFIVYA